LVALHQERKPFFFEKKNQKTFDFLDVPLRRRGCTPDQSVAKTS
jgi:hypothetical protein